MIISGQNRLKPVDFLNLLPLVFILISFSGYLFTQLSDTFLNVWLKENPSILAWSGYYVFILISPLYFIASTILLVNHRRKIRGFFSNRSKVDLPWLYYVTLGFGTYLTIGLISIAFDSGFNSKSAFYTFFRKKTGMTPGEYIRQKSLVN